jgi:thioredoxin reductase
MTKQITIIGGGIAGLTAAIAGQSRNDFTQSPPKL